MNKKVVISAILLALIAVGITAPIIYVLYHSIKPEPENLAPETEPTIVTR
jgi:hypothetical protein